MAAFAAPRSSRANIGERGLARNVCCALFHSTRKKNYQLSELKQAGIVRADVERGGVNVCYGGNRMSGSAASLLYTSSGIALRQRPQSVSMISAH